MNSGGIMSFERGIGRTVIGELASLSTWRLLYAQTNPSDTDNGYHPQNIFRLVTRSEWTNFRQEAYFKITGNVLSDSSNRNASNGLLLFHRYKEDGETLYYAGIRVDGAAVIKKKINGEYFTLAYNELFTGEPYDKTKNPNLLPKNVWIGLRSEIITKPDRSVVITLFTNTGKNGVWVKSAEARDDGKSQGGRAILEKGYAGIRTDFMDVVFSNYHLENIDDS